MYSTKSRQTYSESDLSVSINAEHLRYDEEGPGKAIRYCDRKEADFVVLFPAEIVVIEVKRDAWFKGLMEDHDGSLSDAKICELANTVLDTLSGLLVVRLSSKHRPLERQERKIKALILINCSLAPDSWNLIDDRVRRGLRRKFRNLPDLQFAVEHAGGELPGWLSVS